MGKEIAELGRCANVREITRRKGATIRIVQSSFMSETDTDAWICFITEDLKLEGSLNQAIFEEAGPELENYILDTIYQPKPGDVFNTPAFGAPVDHLLFAVVPNWQGGFLEEMHDIARCYRNVIRKAVQMDLSSIAFPALGMCHPKFPMVRAVRVAMQAIVDEATEPLKLVSVICKEEESFNAYGERADSLRLR